MSDATVIINDQSVSVRAIYYISNNNYYLIYTDEQIDNNGFVILHVAKILQEVVTTQNGPQPTGYLIGTTIASDEEYDLVKQDIAGIIDAKQNAIDAKVQFIDGSVLGQIKIKDTKIFRLKKNIFEQIFGQTNNDIKTDEQTSLNNSLEQKYQEEVDKNRKIKQEIDKLQEQINNLKNILQ